MVQVFEGIALQQGQVGQISLFNLAPIGQGQVLGTAAGGRLQCLLWRKSGLGIGQEFVDQAIEGRIGGAAVGASDNLHAEAVEVGGVFDPAFQALNCGHVVGVVGATSGAEAPGGLQGAIGGWTDDDALVADAFGDVFVIAVAAGGLDKVGVFDHVEAGVDSALYALGGVAVGGDLHPVVAGYIGGGAHEFEG